MAEPMSIVSPEKLNTNMQFDDDIYADEPPSSPFVAHFEGDDNQENVAPTPPRQLIDFDEDDDENMPQSAFRVSSEKRFGLKERSSPVKMPTKNLMEDFEEAALKENSSACNSPKKSSPVKATPRDRSGSVMSVVHSPSKSSRHPSVDLHQQTPSLNKIAPQVLPTPSKRPSPSSHRELRDNEGLTVAMQFTDESHADSFESLKRQKMYDDHFDLDLENENTEYNPDGPDATSADIDDTGFSMFSEMPGLDMTKFASLKKSPTKNDSLDNPEATPRARAQMTPSTVRRSERTPSPTPRRTAYKENDTTNLLLDFTAQFESYGTARRGSSSRSRTSPTKSTNDSNLRSYYQNQRSPAKGGNFVPSTPGQSRQLLNLLDFELPPPPTPRSLPTVTIREMESLKSQFQSQISSLTASLSGKEAEVVSLAKAIADAERRVGEAQEIVRDERSAREYAEAQMVDWKKKGEEVQELLQNVQSEMAHNDAERDQLLTRLVEAERRAEEADSRSSELETRLIEAESKNVDMTTFINDDEGDEKKKIYTEVECQTAIAEKVNEVARDLHSAYKAKHEKKIKALKDNYQKKADERCKELRLQIIRLESQVEEAEKHRDDTFSPAKHRPTADTASNPSDLARLESQRAELENLKARLAGLQSELQSLRQSHATTLEELEAERVEKGELVAAAEQMLSLCGEKMEEMQQQDFRRSTAGGAPPTPAPVTTKSSAPTPRAAPEQAMRNTGFLAGGSSTTSRPGSSLGGGRPGSAVGDRPQKQSGMRAPGGFGFQNSSGSGGSALGRSTSGGSAASKSRLLSNIEKMGGTKGGE